MAQFVEENEELLLIEDFGVTLSADSTRFKVWAPSADKVTLAIYETWNDYYRKEYPMEPGLGGVWALDIPVNMEGKFYSYILNRYGQLYEVLDPCARAASVNAKRCQVLDPSSVNPEGWETHPIPEPVKLGHMLIYEAHIRDFSMHPDSGIVHKGKYLGLAERGTCTESGQKTGLDHLIELGVTHLHILPVADFSSVDETNPIEYNWGYDPILYNVPEGSYSTNPMDGRSRIMELKQAIKGIHEAGIRVVLDVVYNHTFHGDKSCFNYLAQNYYYRTDAYGRFTNGSGVGNEVATERPMVRKYIVDSLKFWLREYKVDGFRFDLLGLYDRETVQTICRELRAIKPDILLYGEPWIGGDSGLPHEMQFLKGAQRGLPIALFNDDFRKALKGDSDGYEEGFITSMSGLEPQVAVGLAGSIDLKSGMQGFAFHATESINYISCHDNLILYDKICKVEPGQPFEIIKSMNRLGLTMILTSFGIPFLQMGTEFLRNKGGHHNSYNAPDSVNQVDWSLKETNRDLFDYVADLIAFRKSQKIFSIGDPDVIRRAVSVLLMDNNTVVIRVRSPYKGDYTDMIFVHYAGWADRMFALEPMQGMRILCCGERVGHGLSEMRKITRSRIRIKGIRSLILVRTE